MERLFPMQHGEGQDGQGRDSEGRDADEPSRDEPSGDPVCWLSLVCPECGRVPEGPGGVCERCGAPRP